MTVEIHVGDCLDVLRGMADDSVDVCITDPPYNVGKDYGAAHDDRLDVPEFVEWLGMRLREAARVSRGGLVYFPGKSSVWTVPDVLRVVGLRPTTMLGWHRSEFAGDWFKSGKPAMCWEPIVWAAKGKPFTNLLYSTAGRDFLVVKSHRMETTPLKELHPCPKPTEVMSWLVGLFAPEGGSVLDPFAGLGTTGLVAARLGRKAVLVEHNPEYAAAARSRIDADAPLYRKVTS